MTLGKFLGKFLGIAAFLVSEHRDFSPVNLARLAKLSKIRALGALHAAHGVKPVALRCVTYDKCVRGRDKAVCPVAAVKDPELWAVLAPKGDSMRSKMPFA